MATLISACDRDNARDLLEGAFRLRKRILVDKLHWELPSGDGPLETDQFDGGETCHLVSLGPDGTVRGTLRASCSLEPNVSSEILQAHFVNKLPRARHIGEASRFCVDLDLSPMERLAVRADIYVGMLELCVERGWTQLMGVLRQGVLFEFTRLGMSIDLLSPPILFGAGSDLAAAFLMDTTQTDLDRISAKFGIKNVLRGFRAPSYLDHASAA